MPRTRERLVCSPRLVAPALLAPLAPIPLRRRQPPPLPARQKIRTSALKHGVPRETLPNGGSPPRQMVFHVKHWLKADSGLAPPGQNHLFFTKKFHVEHDPCAFICDSLSLRRGLLCVSRETMTPWGHSLRPCLRVSHETMPPWEHSLCPRLRVSRETTPAKQLLLRPAFR